MIRATMPFADITLNRCCGSRNIFLLLAMKLADMSVGEALKDLQIPLDIITGRSHMRSEGTDQKSFF